MKKILHFAAALLLALPAVQAQTLSGSLTTSSPLSAGVDGGALSYFSAQKQDNNSAMLQWSTVSEMNVSHFEVEKSTDGKNYNSIGRVAATGNDHAGEHAYTLTDPALSAGINTYRLKMVDEDGTFTYSKVALLSGMAQQMTTVSLYPNPASAITMLSMTAVTPSTMRVIVADQIGRAVLSQQYNVEVGRNDQPLDISALTPGAYTLQWWAGEETGTLKLMKNKQ